MAAMLNARRGARDWSGPTTLTLFLALCGTGCETEQTLEPTVDARPGIEQVGSAEGPLLDEGEACERLREVLVAARDRENCDDVVIEECPGLVRPGGSLACLRFSEESIDACSERVGEYDSCRDFENDACIVVAVVDEMTEGCVPPGPPSDGGADDDATEPDGSDDDSDDDVADDDVGFDDDVPPVDAGEDDDVGSDDDAASADDDVTPDDAGSADDDGEVSTVPDSSAPVPDSGPTEVDASSEDDPSDAGASVSDAGDAG
jgi:hypothetical protein